MFQAGGAAERCRDAAQAEEGEEAEEAGGGSAGVFPQKLGFKFTQAPGVWLGGPSEVKHRGAAQFKLQCYLPQSSFMRMHRRARERRGGRARCLQ